MSFKALAWVVDQRPARSVDKLLLYGLADRHNTEDNTAWPSIAWLVEFSGLDRKTVQAGLVRLIDDGYISDTGERKGPTKRVRVFRINLTRTAANGDELPRTTAVNETIPKTGSLGNGPVFPYKRSQKRDAEPVKEPVKHKRGTRAREATPTDCPEDFTPSISEGTETAKVWYNWTPDRQRQEVEAFKAHHISRGNRMKNWNKAFTTWAINSVKFARERADRDAARFGGQRRGDGFDHIKNSMVRAGLRAEAGRRSSGR